jgi:hypothetical protein
MLAVGLGCGSLGCGTLVGYGIGHAVDNGHFEELPRPYAQSLAPAVGSKLRATVGTGHTIGGELIGVEAPTGGDVVCFIRSVRRTAMAGREIRVDTVAVASILAAQVARDSHTYRDAGIFAGAVADATIICLVAVLAERVGVGGSQ